MEFSIWVTKGEDVQSASLEESWVTVMNAERRVERRWLAAGDPTDAAIAWAKERARDGWSVDGVAFGDAAPRDVASALERLRPGRLNRLRWTAGESSSIDSLEPLTPLTDLRSLSLTRLRASALPALARLTRLTRLDLAEWEGRLDDLPPLPSVESLTLTGGDGDVLSLVKPFPKLESLSLRSVKSLDALRGTRLKAFSLQLGQGEEELSLAPLEAIAPTLETLVIAYLACPITDTEAIGRCVNLRKLELRSLPIDGVDLTSLTHLTSLSILLAGALDLAAIGKLRALTRLVFDGPVTSLAPLAGLTSLRELVYHGESDLTDLAPLAKLPLEQLWLPRDLELEAAAIEPLADHPMTISWNDGEWSARELISFLDGTDEIPPSDGLARPAIVLESAAGKGGPTGSHTGGTPWLAGGESWPTCKNCSRPMPLFLQLDLAELDLRTPVAGFLQLFYCNASDPCCAIDCAAWDGGDRSLLLRVIQPLGEPAAVERPAFPQPIAERRLSLGEIKEDNPTFADAWSLYAIPNEPYRTLCGDKLLGWPNWVRTPKWPTCADCGERMEHVVQLESNRAIDHDWGASGRALLFLCPDHPRRTGFVWAGHALADR